MYSCLRILVCLIVLSLVESSKFFFSFIQKNSDLIAEVGASVGIGILFGFALHKWNLPSDEGREAESLNPFHPDTLSLLRSKASFFVFHSSSSPQGMESVGIIDYLRSSVGVSLRSLVVSHGAKRALSPLGRDWFSRVGLCIFLSNRLTPHFTFVFVNGRLDFSFLHRRSLWDGGTVRLGLALFMLSYIKDDETSVLRPIFCLLGDNIRLF